jgi:hypothetical protein
MPITYFPTSPMSQRPYSTEHQFLHVSNDMDCGVRFSYSYRTNPLGKYILNYSSLSDSEVATLENFFASMRGSYGTFAFLDPGGNLVPSSETYIDGSQDYWKGTAAGRTTSLSAAVLPSDGAGITLCTSIYIKPDAAGQSWTIGHTGGSRSYTSNSTNWMQISYTSVLASSGAITATVAGASAIMCGFNCVPLPGPGGYVRTPGAGLAYRSNCRFATDTFSVKYTGVGESSVTLPIVEIGYAS